MRNILTSIKTYNEGRLEPLLQLKYEHMAGSIFGFYRATCHLFYKDWHTYTLPKDTPLAWLCGDMHFGNFGSFKGANKLVYFDMNDFDEAFLGPVLCDVVRMLTSIRVAAVQLAIDKASIDGLCKTFINTYTKNLAQGHSYMVERDTATGYVKKFLEQAQNRTSKTFLERRTNEKQQELLIMTGHTLALQKKGIRRNNSLVQTMAGSTLRRKNISFPGCSFSHCRHRQLRHSQVLRAGGEPGNGKKHIAGFLNKALPSSALPYITQKQPAWNCEAERVCNVQQRMQATSPALLSYVNAGKESYLVRKLQPTEDKVNLEVIAGDKEALEEVLVAMGEILAWNQLRSSGRQGAAIADELMGWADKKDWQKEALTYAKQYAEKVETDYDVFCKSYKEGTTLPANTRRL